MRVTIGEMLGQITAHQGDDIEKGLKKQNVEPGAGAEEREFQPSGRRVRVIEVQHIRPRRR
jgi:hypothetical protein